MSSGLRNRNAVSSDRKNVVYEVSTPEIASITPSARKKRANSRETSMRPMPPSVSRNQKPSANNIHKPTSMNAAKRRMNAILNEECSRTMRPRFRIERMSFFSSARNSRMMNVTLPG